MKSITIIVILLLISSCNNLSELEKKSQNYMVEIIKRTNSVLPKKLDEYTIAKEAKYNKKKREVIYIYELNEKYLNDNSSKEIENNFEQIEKEQIERAKNNQGKDPNYETLKVAIKSVYKNKENEILYSFVINPQDYLKSELEKVRNKEDKLNNKLFSDEAFTINFKQGVNYKFHEKTNKKTDKLEYLKGYSIPTSTLEVTTNLKNPFEEIIEQSEITIEIVLKYRVGTFKYKSKQYRNYLDNSNKLKDFDVSGFFVNKTTSLEELQGYVDYFNEISKYVLEEKNNQKDRLLLRKKYLHQYYSSKDIERLESSINEFNVYFDNNEHFKYFTNILKYKFSPTLFTKKSFYCLRLFKDFERIKNAEGLNNPPTINRFKVDNAEINIYLKASNTNGFSFDGKIKSINVTDEWNNHFVK